jgi:hypothetical protein
MFAVALALVAGAVLPSPASAAIVFTPDVPAVGQEVTFAASLDVTGTFTAWRHRDWDLDADGAFDDAVDTTAASWSFNAPGDRVVKFLFDVTVTNCNGDICTSRSISGVQTATVPVRSRPPSVSLAASDTNVQVGTAVGFSITASDPDGDALTLATTIPGVANAFQEREFKYTFVTPGVFNVVATATDRWGVGQSAQIRVTVRPDDDVDDDGDPATADCDDNNASVRHGVPEIPQNGIDDDCAGKPADGPFASVPSSISIRYRAVRGGVRVRSLAVMQILGGSTIEVRCSSARCPRRTLSRTLPASRRRLELRGFFRGRTFSRGVIEVRVTMPEMLGRVRRDRIRKGDVGDAVRLCLDPRRVGQPVGFVDTSLPPRSARGQEQCG